MQRRELLKNVGLGLGAIISLPSWANGWNAKTLGNVNVLSEQYDTLLADLVDTIIPLTDTPGAKTLEVHKLIQKVVYDCQGKEAANELGDKLAAFNKFVQNKNNGKGFSELGASERFLQLSSIEKEGDATQKNFLKQMKGLTIDGFLKSEYGQVNIIKYEWAPARYYGCVPVPKG
jgi:hypothetical protein